MTFIAAEDRYTRHPYRRVGRSGLHLPEVSLGLWQDFGDETPVSVQRAILRRAFDLGVTHFDLANNYGPPYGHAESGAGAGPTARGERDRYQAPRSFRRVRTLGEVAVVTSSRTT